MSDFKNSAKIRSGLLARRILLLCLSLVLIISTAFTTATLVFLDNTSSKELRVTAELTMRYLNRDIENTLLPVEDLASNIAALIPGIESFDTIKRTLVDLLPLVPSVFEIYYGTTLSRFNGGNFVCATDWDPYKDNPEWDQTKRPWFFP